MIEQHSNNHSPGPWGARVDNAGVLLVDLGKECRAFIRFIILGDMEVTEGEDHWNAALIAAAPDLYRALKRIVEVHEGPGETDAPMMIAGRAAIAKAETFAT